MLFQNRGPWPSTVFHSVNTKTTVTLRNEWTWIIKKETRVQAEGERVFPDFDPN